MEINITAVNELIKNKFRNNKTWFAEVIGINNSYLNRILNGKAKTSGFKVCNTIINYCKKNNLDYTKYVSF